MPRSSFQPAAVDPPAATLRAQRPSVSPGSRGPSSDVLRDAVMRTEAHMRAEDYRGYDPYDALQSPLFRGRPFASSRRLRFAAQQVVKRSPVNIRPALGIKKGLNPVTLGLAAQGYADLLVAGVGERERYLAAADECVTRLADLRSPGYAGACWGYDFDWQARRVRIPAGMPTVVATGFVTNALMNLHRVTGSTLAAELCQSATRFLLGDLRRTPQARGFCWSYSPVDEELVLNASMKGARLCAQVYALTGEEELRTSAWGAVEFALECQRGDGAWPYSIGDERSWVDNFHTGYMLDCLDEYGACTGDDRADEAKSRGWRYYQSNLFEPGGIARARDDRRYPIDATACAQSVLTLCRFGDVSRAGEVAGWALEQLQLSSGAFAYQRHRAHTVRVPYMRWSTAWMFCALARLLRHRGS